MLKNVFTEVLCTKWIQQMKLNSTHSPNCGKSILVCSNFNMKTHDCDPKWALNNLP